MFKIFNVWTEKSTWEPRLFNLEHIIAARPTQGMSIIITTLLGEFEVAGTLADLEDVK